MKDLSYIIKEFKRTYFNIGNRKGAFIVFWYRIAHLCVTSGVLLRMLTFPYILVYRIFIRDILAFDLHEKTYIGNNFIVWHGFGVAIHPHVKIGNNCIIRHNVTIGNSRNYNDVPIIENNVEIGANSVIIGKIVIAEGTIIGAGSIVTHTTKPYSVVCGNPAKLIKYRNR